MAEHRSPPKSWQTRGNGNGNGNGSLSMLRSMMILVQFLTLILSGILTTWVWNQNSRQMQTELMVQALQTWRESAKPQDEADHILLGKVSTELMQRAMTLEQVVGLIRDMKWLLDGLSTQQIALRQSLVRIEDHLGKPSDTRSFRK